MASRQFVVFTIDEQEYGIEVLTVNGILRAKKFVIKIVPGMSETVEGIINLRGEIKYLYNLRSKFNLAKKPIPEEGKFIMLNVNGSGMGWIVDEVTDIVKIDDEELEATPSGINAGGNNYVESIGKFEERLIVILNPEKIVVQEDFSDLDKIDSAGI